MATNTVMNDSWGHVSNEEERGALIAAIALLNSNETIAAMEEDANHHREDDFRREMADSLHVADLSDWKQADWHSDYEEAECKVCGGLIEREKE